MEVGRDRQDQRETHLASEVFHLFQHLEEMMLSQRSQESPLPPESWLPASLAPPYLLHSHSEPEGLWGEGETSWRGLGS